MDRLVSATEANQRFSEMLRDVSAGGSVTITSRGRPVARLVPVERKDRKAAIDALLAMSRALPVHYSGPWSREDLYE